MDLSHHFTIPVPVEQAWAVLLDVPRIAPCMPGATLESARGETFDGTVKVKVGPITVTYKGTAEITEKDEAARRAVIRASGKETRGSGTASATVTTQLVERGSQTDVTVDTTLAITGKPAQFGRSVMSEVAQKLLNQFADCLAEELGRPEPDTAEPPSATEAAAGEAPAAEAPPTAAAEKAPQRARSAEAIDLLAVAGGPVGRRLLPVAAGLAVLALLVWLVRRRR